MLTILKQTIIRLKQNLAEIALAGGRGLKLFVLTSYNKTYLIITNHNFPPHFTHTNRIACPPLAVVLSVLAFVQAETGMTQQVAYPAYRCDSVKVQEAAGFRNRAIAAYSHHVIYLPSYFEGDTAYQRSIIAHELTHYLQDITHSPLSAKEQEAQAYAVQAAYSQAVKESLTTETQEGDGK